MSKYILTRVSCIIVVGFLAGIAIAPVAKGEVVVELVPDNPGPYTGGESLTVDVWLHSEVPSDSYLWVVQLDFSDSDVQLVLDPTFTFDLSSSMFPEDFHEVYPELPIPRAANTKEYICPECRLQLPAGGSLHIGNIGVRLPNEAGTYRLDVLNADDPDETHGAQIVDRGASWWRAFTGEVTGGAYPFVVLAPIPTMSQWGIAAMGLLLLVLGCLMIIRRTRSATDASCSLAEGTGTRSVCSGALRSHAPLFGLICAGGVFLGSSNNTEAQAPLVPVETIEIGVDSGIVSSTGTGSDPVVMFSRVVQVKGAPWVRLRFGEVRLSGSSADGNESFIRITSLCDDGVQLLDSFALRIWGGSSAYFNGDRVLVELVAHANTGANRLIIDRVAAGTQSELDSTSSICEADDRVPSSDPRAARFRFQALGFACTRETWCTAFLFDAKPNCLLTAGHCCSGADFNCGFMSCDVQGEFPAIVEFNVPPSEPDGTINCAAPEDQYPVDVSSVQFQYAGIGDDWCSFGVFNNTTTGLSPLVGQGASYQLVQTVPSADASTLRITGYGCDETCHGPYNEDNGIQQTDSGPFQDKDGTTVKYRIDTLGGNSGSAVEHVSDGLVYAIHTNGGCTPTGGTNKGTAVDHPGLQGALACPIGVCTEDCNSNGIYDRCDIDCLSLCGDCNVPGCGESNDCNANGIPDECDNFACCFNDGSCTDITECACNAQGGTFAGPGTYCASLPDGACCMSDATCSFISECSCNAQGGTYKGDGVDCFGVTTLKGVCCVGTNCIPNKTECACDALGGNFLGSGSKCTPMQCQQFFTPP